MRYRRRVPQLVSVGEIEYYAPTKSSRQIHTAFLNGFFYGVELRRIVSFELGMTATAAGGYINQRGAILPSNAAGLGPILAIRCQPFHVGRFSLSLDVVGAVVLYSARFPGGGDFYNFTWRLGGAAVVKIDARWSFTAGVRWMHVSNGQGLTPKNPSYEGVGIPVGFIYRWD